MQALITQLRTERFMKEKTEPNKIEEVAQTLEQEIEELEKQLAELNDMREGARLSERAKLGLRELILRENFNARDLKEEPKQKRCLILIQHDSGNSEHSENFKTRIASPCD